MEYEARNELHKESRQQREATNAKKRFDSKFSWRNVESLDKKKPHPFG